MLTPCMIDERFRDSQEIASRDFDDADVELDAFLDESGRAFETGEIGLDSLKSAIRLYTAAANAIYAQAILQSTGAIESL